VDWAASPLLIYDNVEIPRNIYLGMWRVEYDTLRRIPKQSAYWYSDIIKQNAITI